jgi:hypothetical protein
LKQLAIAALLLVVTGSARADSMFAAKRAATTYTLAVRESQTIPHAGATAAWAIDANIVDVVAQNGTITLFGRGAGRTKVIVISATGEAAFEVIVNAKPGPLAAQKQQAQSDRGTAEVRYSSAARELQNSVTVTRESKETKTELHLRTAHVAGEPAGDRARTSIPSASLRFFRKSRELTLLDRDVDHSPLTLSNTPVRGIHYLDEHWRLHAGYTAYATYQSFLVPLEREFVAGAGYAFRTGPNAHLTPGLFAYGDGTVLSMLYDYDDRDRLALRAELGYSRGFGIAAQLAYASNRDHARADLRYRGDDFAVASAGTPRGLLADASFSHQYGIGSNVAAAVQASTIADTRVFAASADVEHRVSDRVALNTGASFGSFDGHRSLTIPAGVRLDFARGGVGALYRYTQSHANRGGHGFRLSARASLGRAYLSAYADRQQNAPTLEVIFDEHPELAIALQELGIVATSPGDIARALREHAALIELGFIEGVTVDLAPTRTLLGFEFALLGGTASRNQLRARVVRSVIESVSSQRTSTLASLTYSRRLRASTDIFAGYTYWRTERRGEEPRDTPFVEVGLRQRFDELPSLPGLGGGTISGVVFADEDLDGASDGTPVVAEVELDGMQKKRTNADGTFSFTNVPRGAHRITARVPDRTDAYFTTPARVEVETGDRVEFGVAYTPARLQGRVTSDAGDGLVNVRVLLARGATQVVATTGSDGAFAIAAAPGEWQVSLVSDSVPAGYSLAGTDARAVLLERATPRDASWSLRANRSVTGTGATPNAELEVRPSGKKIRADEQGRFSIRSLPAGEITVVAGGVEHRLTLPHAPATMQLDLTSKVAAAEPAVRTVVSGERRDSMRWSVAIGAFRVHANAVATVARARQNGVAARIDESGALTVVRSGPYDSRAAAAADAEKLTRAGLEAVVVSTK